MNHLTCAAALSAALLAGCAAAPHPAQDATPHVAHRHAVDTDNDLRTYRTVYVESFAFAPGALPAARHAVNPDEPLAQLQAAFVGELANAGVLATAPARGVAIARVTVTRVDTSSPTLNVISSLIAMVPLDTGGAALSVSFRDSETGRDITRFELDDKATPLNIRGSFARYGHAKGLVRQWGREVARLFAAPQSGPKVLAASTS